MRYKESIAARGVHDMCGLVVFYHSSFLVYLRYYEFCLKLWHTVAVLR